MQKEDEFFNKKQIPYLANEKNHFVLLQLNTIIRSVLPALDFFKVTGSAAKILRNPSNNLRVSL